jgi:beta-xylosidase
LSFPGFISAASDAGTVVSAPWISDQGDGTYRNPVLFADYSDPDAIRVGEDYYLVASSFHAVPGLPVLHSKDLVNWRIINHVFGVQRPVDHFATVRHGEGAWAPAIRFHKNKYWVFFPDPDFGIYVSTATDPAGNWSEPVLIKAGKGLIDPCPFWDDDGQAYLIHGWALSRAGIANQLTLHKLDADITRVVDAGETIIDGNKIPDWRTLEGPKLYKRNGYYYVFAPSGGVPQGYQAVFRSRNIYGPYEHRIVLAQGETVVNGPHQGAWVDTVKGEDWFLHFQDCGPFGRVMHLQPMVWHDDWPVIGSDPDGDGKGAPFLTHTKPDVGRNYPIETPQTSDEFDGKKLGLQWQWNANPQPGWASLVARAGFLHLNCVPSPEKRSSGAPAIDTLYDTPNLLLQKFPAPEFTVTTELRFFPAVPGETAGLLVFGYDYAWVGLCRTATGLRLVYMVNTEAKRPDSREKEIEGIEVKDSTIYLRVTVDQNALCRFAYSFDGEKYSTIGKPFSATVDRWVGAKVGLFASAPAQSQKTGHADFNWFRFEQFVH